MDKPIELPIDGVLDLHTFDPREVKDLVPDYLAACQARGILLVRIIHGKGVGNLRRTVHAILKKHPEVISFTLDHPQFGGWGRDGCATACAGVIMLRLSEVGDWFNNADSDKTMSQSALFNLQLSTCRNCRQR